VWSRRFHQIVLEGLQLVEVDRIQDPHLRHAIHLIPLETLPHGHRRTSLARRHFTLADRDQLLQIGRSRSGRFAHVDGTAPFEYIHRK
jgi:hypothetical protein